MSKLQFDRGLSILPVKEASRNKNIGLPGITLRFSGAMPEGLYDTRQVENSFLEIS